MATLVMVMVTMLMVMMMAMVSSMVIRGHGCGHQHRHHHHHHHAEGTRRARGGHAAARALAVAARQCCHAGQGGSRSRQAGQQPHMNQSSLPHRTTSPRQTCDIELDERTRQWEIARSSRCFAQGELKAAVVTANCG